MTMKLTFIWITGVALALLAAFALSQVAQATQPSDSPKKVVICHATSSEQNPYNEIEVSENAIGGHFDNPGTPKAGHEDDLLLKEGEHCPEGDGPTGGGNDDKDDAQDRINSDTFTNGAGVGGGRG